VHRPRAGLAFQIDLVFFGSVILRAKKHETMESQNGMDDRHSPYIGL